MSCYPLASLLNGLNDIANFLIVNKNSISKDLRGKNGEIRGNLKCSFLNNFKDHT